MANRIAFLSRLPASEMLSRLYGMEHLSQQGFDVFFVDLSGFIDGLNEQHLYQKKDTLNDCETILVRQIEELDVFVKETTTMYHHVCSSRLSFSIFCCVHHGF